MSYITVLLLFYMSKDPLTTHLFEPLYLFLKKAHMFWRASTKPDRAEFGRVVAATGIGFLILGFLGFFCKTYPYPHLWNNFYLDCTIEISLQVGQGWSDGILGGHRQRLLGSSSMGLFLRKVLKF